MGSNHVSRGKVIDEIRRRVISWEREHWVAYPWRLDRTPYKVLIAELLLKRTTRQAVLREFPKFVQRFPDFSAISTAPVEALEDSLRHLGLYRQRAKHLKELAEVIVKRYGGKVPDKWEDLIALPGVGIYLAGAVLSFGYGRKAPVLDSNVVRLLSRLTGVKAKRYEEYLKLLWELVPDEEHEYFNYGLIDLGALVCHYKQPRCRSCPLREFCVQYLESIGENSAAGRSARRVPDDKLGSRRLLGQAGRARGGGQLQGREQVQRVEGAAAGWGAREAGERDSSNVAGRSGLLLLLRSWHGQRDGRRQPDLPREQR